MDAVLGGVTMEEMAIRGASFVRGPSPGVWKKRLLVFTCAYVFAELLLMPLVAMAAPLRLRAKLGSPMYILGESSKSGYLPVDYVLILGDSYAEGHGDWLTSALEEGGRPPFQATHVLHEETGRDVVSFGRGGADNVSSIAFLTEKRFASLGRLGWEDPAEVLIYFYEGNDLNENLCQARKRLGLGDREVNSYTDEELDAFVVARARSGSWLGLPGMLYVPSLFVSMVQGGAAGGMQGAGYAHHVQRCDEAARDDAVVSAFRSGGEIYRFRVPMQGPALELDPSETTLALRLFACSLAWAKDRFPSSRLSVVYIPAPLSCYELVSAEVHAQEYEGRGQARPSKSVWPRSDELRARVGDLVRGLNIEFVDPTPELRALGRTRLIHGPADGKHFNRAGYTALANCIREEVLSK